MKRCGGRVRWLAAGVALLAAGAGWAAVPSTEKVASAAAEANAVAGRARPLLLDVSLRIAGGGPKAEGVLATHPTGLARLELKGPSGFVERHLLLGADYRASRDGALLDTPHPFLPPVFLLQATSGAALSAALGSFGVRPGEVVLGRVGDSDCYVFGGRERGLPEGVSELPSLWVDMRSYEPVRIVADATEYRLGPAQDFSGVRLPAWIEIRTPSVRARLEVLGATEASAPAAAFRTDWLTAPLGEAASGEAR